MTHVKCGVLVGLCVVAAASGQTWNAGAGGAWSTASNWSPQTVPGSSSTAAFRNPTSGDVTFSANVRTFFLTVDGMPGVMGSPTSPNAARFSLVGSTRRYDVTDTIRVGDFGRGELLVQGGGLLLANSLLLGVNTGSAGGLWVSGTNTTVGAAGVLRLGWGGSATAHVRSRGWLYAGGQLQLAWNPGLSATLTIDGENHTGSPSTSSRATAGSNGMVIGASGTGTLRVMRGGYLESAGNVSLGGTVDGQGTLEVDGPNSTMLSSGQFLVGFQGVGTTTVRAGGYAYVNNNVYVGNGTPTIFGTQPSGTVSVTGVGGGFPSALWATGSIYNGWSSDATLRAQSGGLVHADGDFVSALDRAATVEVSGAGSRLEAGGFVGLGLRALATTNVTSGGLIFASNQIQLGIESAGNGVVTVHGVGSRLQAGDAVFAGRSGRATLRLEAGGRIDAPVVSVGSDPSSQGDMFIDGSGSLCNATSGLEIADIGTSSQSHRGVVRLTSGGRATVGDYVQIAERGRLEVSGSGSVGIGAGVQATAGTLLINSSGTLNLFGGEVQASRVEGPGALAVTSGVIFGNVVASGATGVGGNTIVNAPRLLVPPRVTRQTRLAVSGTFEQTTSGTLTVSVAPWMRSSSVGSALQPGIDVGGAVTLAGQLVIAPETGLAPAIGDRYVLIQAGGGVQGRFTRVTGLQIDQDKFYAVAYRPSSVELIVVEAPRALGGGRLAPGAGAGNLMLCTHGWNASAADWPSGQIGQAAASLDSTQFGRWAFATLDWSPFNSLLSGPTAAANFAMDIGECLAWWMQERQMNWAHMHLVGHSAGSWLVDAVSRNRSGGTSHLTLLDAYTGWGIRRSASSLGASATFAEHIVDMESFLGASCPWWTGEQLAGCHNISIERLRSTGGGVACITAHGWPYEWYRLTTQFPADPSITFGLGFAASLERANLPSHSMLPRGGLTILRPGGGASERYGPPSLIPLLIPQIPSSTFGSVTFDATGATLRTESPAILSMNVSSALSTNFVTMDVEWLGATPGTVSISISGVVVGVLSSEALPVGGLASTGQLWLPSVLPAGAFTVEVRLDPAGVDQAAVRVSGLTLGFAPRLATPCVADITGIGGLPAAPDGLVTGDDFVAFINAYAAGVMAADVTGIGGPPAAPDGLLTGDDFIAFVNTFASGCP